MLPPDHITTHCQSLDKHNRLVYSSFTFNKEHNMENDQDRWEHEVQRHQEMDDLKQKVIDALGWSIAFSLLMLLFWLALAA